MSYTNVFGSATVPSAKAKFASFSLTANQTFYWSYNSADTTYQVADIMEFTTTTGLSITFPAANQVSVGESALVRNVGSNTFTILDAAGGTLGTVASGTAKLFYVNNNSTVAGTWSVLTFGTGTSAADATTLQGYGLLAISATLNENHPVVTTSTAYTVTTANRANTLVFTGGSVNCTLPTLATAVNGFTLSIKNNGSGTITFVPQGAETIDQSTIAPGESVYLIAGASSWVTVGYGRSTTFAFTRLNKDLSGFGLTDATISSAESQNKIINFYGSPTQNLNVVFPGVASVYYVSSALTTYTITLKTATGASVTLAHGDSSIVVCDGVNFSIALSSSYATNISLPSGTSTTPSLRFSSSSNTGLYLPAAGQLGLVANGAERVRIDNSSGSSTTYHLNSVEIGRIDGAWQSANFTVGYGSITAGYNGAPGISLIPAVSSNNITLDTAKDSTILAKSYTLASSGTSTVLSSNGTIYPSITIASSGALTIGNDLLLNGASGSAQLGFTTGAGGTVTQATSKSTTVTLNKSTGQITMNNASLAGGATVAFQLTNSLISTSDTVNCNVVASGNYMAQIQYATAGSCVIRVTNITGGSLSEAVFVNFTIIKGAVS